MCHLFVSYALILRQLIVTNKFRTNFFSLSVKIFTINSQLNVYGRADICVLFGPFGLVAGITTYLRPSLLRFWNLIAAQRITAIRRNMWTAERRMNNSATIQHTHIYIYMYQQRSSVTAIQHNKQRNRQQRKTQQATTGNR